MSVKQTLLIIALPFALSSFAVADEPVKQPEPLEKVTVDLGLLKEHFKVVNYKLYQSGEFKSLGNPRRKISEQALVWTLQAKADLTGKQAAGFFERPAFPRVRFYSTATGKDKPADARKQGYFLATDRRWIRGDGASLKRGDLITVYTPIGKTGAADLIKNGASKVVFQKADKAPRRKLPQK